jgi:predicted lipoprotein with Yx(FWY)xxD motif
MSARLPIAISLALVPLLAVAGCGGGGGGATAATGASTPATGASTAKAPSSAATVDVSSSAGLGPILVDSQGRTLYLFQKDSAGMSRCSGACARIWPPQLTKGSPKAGGGASAAMLGTIKRSDGSMQVTYAGHPLYTYTADTGPGQARGNGLDLYGAVWNAVKPDGSNAPAGTPGGSGGASTSSGYGY